MVGVDFFIYAPEEFDTLLEEGFPFLTDILKKGKIPMKRETEEKQYLQDKIPCHFRAFTER